MVLIAGLVILGLVYGITEYRLNKGTQEVRTTALTLIDDYSGLSAIRIVIDNTPDTVIVPGMNNTEEVPSYGDEVYIHVAMIDANGNISETTHSKQRYVLPLNMGVIVE